LIDLFLQSTFLEVVWADRVLVSILSGWPVVEYVLLDKLCLEGDNLVLEIFLRAVLALLGLIFSNFSPRFCFWARFLLDPDSEAVPYGVVGA